MTEDRQRYSDADLQEFKKVIQEKIAKAEKDFELTDRISISLEEDSPFKTELINNNAYISEEVLCNQIEFVNSLPIFDEIEIDEVKFKVNVNKI